MAVGRTSKAGKEIHAHDYRVNSFGNGITSDYNGHSHKINKNVVMETSGHTHSLGEFS